MKKFVKNPIEIEAMQFDGSEKSAKEIAGHFQDTSIEIETETDGSFGCLTIYTLEGHLTVSPNDWVIKGIKGELYPIKPDIFAETYSEVK